MIIFRWRWLNHPGLLVLAVVIGLVAWGASGYHRPVPPGPDSQPLSWTDLSPAGIHGQLAAVLADQRQADADHREAWIADGFSSDLTTLADTVQQAYGTDQLGRAEWRFSQDALTYLTVNGWAGGNPNAGSADAQGTYTAASPAPGWQAQYAVLRADENALALAAGQPMVPDPGYAISGQAVPVHVIWFPYTIGPPPKSGGSSKSGSGTSYSTSVSSSGAHSTTVTTRTKNGNVTTTTTNTTSVSAKGVVTQRHTVTTSG
jgi:hypothetical protein